MDPNASFEELVAAVAKRRETPTKAVGACSRGRAKRSPALSPAAAATAAAATVQAQQKRKQYKRSSSRCGLRQLPKPPGCRKCSGNARGCRIKEHQLEDASDEQVCSSGGLLIDN